MCDICTWITTQLVKRNHRAEKLRRARSHWKTLALARDNKPRRDSEIAVAGLRRILEISEDEHVAS